MSNLVGAGTLGHRRGRRDRRAVQHGFLGAIGGRSERTQRRLWCRLVRIAAQQQHRIPLACRGQRGGGGRRRSGSRGAITFDLLIEHQRPAPDDGVKRRAGMLVVPRGQRAGHEHAQPFRATRGMKQRQPLGQVPDAEAHMGSRGGFPRCCQIDRAVELVAARKDAREVELNRDRRGMVVAQSLTLIGQRLFQKRLGLRGASLARREPAEQGQRVG